MDIYILMQKTRLKIWGLQQSSRVSTSTSWFAEGFQKRGILEATAEEEWKAALLIAQSSNIFPSDKDRAGC